MTVQINVRRHPRVACRDTRMIEGRKAHTNCGITHTPVILVDSIEDGVDVIGGCGVLGEKGK